MTPLWVWFLAVSLILGHFWAPWKPISNASSSIKVFFLRDSPPKKIMSLKSQSIMIFIYKWSKLSKKCDAQFTSVHSNLRFQNYDFWSSTAKKHLTNLRPLSVYSMGDESSDVMKLSPTRKKNWHLNFNLFFPPTWWEDSNFFSQIGSCSVQKQSKSSKCLGQDLTPRILFLFF